MNVVQKYWYERTNDTGTIAKPSSHLPAPPFVIFCWHFCFAEMYHYSMLPATLHESSILQKYAYDMFRARHGIAEGTFFIARMIFAGLSQADYRNVPNAFDFLD